MQLIRTSFFSGIITFIRIASGFVANKVVAIYTGPAGVAIIGSFANFISLVLTFANGGINNGVIKYTSEYRDNDEKKKMLFSTAFKISVYCSLFFGSLLIIFANLFSDLILRSLLYTNAIRLLGFSIILYSLNGLLISILNGLHEIKIFTFVNTIGSIVGLFFTISLVYFFKVDGALYALVLSQSIIFFVTLAIVIKNSWFSFDSFIQPFNRVIAGKLGQYSLMAIITAITVPISQIVLRNFLINEIGMEGAGYWQGMMKVSDGYLLLITTSLSTYYLPKLSSLKTEKELKNEIFKGYKIILPVVLLSCMFIYYLRFLIIKILYTESFNEMEELFLWQLVGDFFKMAAWILSYLMLAKAMTKIYIITEILFTILYVVCGFIFVKYFKLWGITFAFALNYFFYFLTMLFIFRKLIFSKF